VGSCGDPSHLQQRQAEIVETGHDGPDFGLVAELAVQGHAPQVLAAADGDDDGAIHGDDVNRAFQAAFVGVVARWSSRCRVVVGEVPGRRRHGGAGLRTCEDAA
jgi:hypothetical protein